MVSLCDSPKEVSLPHFPLESRGQDPALDPSLADIYGLITSLMKVLTRFQRTVITATTLGTSPNFLNEGSNSVITNCFEITATTLYIKSSAVIYKPLKVRTPNFSIPVGP